MIRQYRLTAILIIFLCIALPAPAAQGWAQEEPASPVAAQAPPAPQTAVENETPPDTAGAAAGMTLLQLVQKGGVVGYLIILLSFVAIALVIDYAFTIRRSKFTPGRDVALLRKLIRDRKYDELKKMDPDQASLISQLVIAGLNEIELGYSAMIKSMEDAGEAVNARLARKIEHLNVIGNISPMLGLLGTVIGMLRCFNEISQVTGSIEPKQLAGGIFEALVTTCMGLIVAIPALYFFAVFRNRVDEVVGEASLKAEELVATFKTTNNKE